MSFRIPPADYTTLADCYPPKKVKPEPPNCTTRAETEKSFRVPISSLPLELEDLIPALENMILTNC